MVPPEPVGDEGAGRGLPVERPFQGPVEGGPALVQRQLGGFLHDQADLPARHEEEAIHPQVEHALQQLDTQPRPRSCRGTEAAAPQALQPHRDDPGAGGLAEDGLHHAVVGVVLGPLAGEAPAGEQQQVAARGQLSGERGQLGVQRGSAAVAEVRRIRQRPGAQQPGEPAQRQRSSVVPPCHQDRREAWCERREQQERIHQGRVVCHEQRARPWPGGLLLETLGAHPVPQAQQRTTQGEKQGGNHWGVLPTG